MQFAICDANPAFRERLARYLYDFSIAFRTEPPVVHTFDSAEAFFSSDLSTDILFLNTELPGADRLTQSQLLTHANPGMLIFLFTPDHFRCFLKRLLPPVLRKSLRIPIRLRKADAAYAPEEIIMAECSGKRLLIHTTRGPVESSISLSALAARLPQESFFQSHRGYIVNLSHTISFTADEIYMDNGCRAYLARRNHNAFKKAFRCHCEKRNAE